MIDKGYPRGYTENGRYYCIDKDRDYIGFTLECSEKHTTTASNADIAKDLIYYGREGRNNLQERLIRDNDDVILKLIERVGNDKQLSMSRNENIYEFSFKEIQWLVYSEPWLIDRGYCQPGIISLEAYNNYGNKLAIKCQQEVCNRAKMSYAWVIDGITQSIQIVSTRCRCRYTFIKTRTTEEYSLKALAELIISIAINKYNYSTVMPDYMCKEETILEQLVDLWNGDKDILAYSIDELCQLFMRGKLILSEDKHLKIAHGENKFLKKAQTISEKDSLKLPSIVAYISKPEIIGDYFHTDVQFVRMVTLNEIKQWVNIKNNRLALNKCIFRRCKYKGKVLPSKYLEIGSMTLKKNNSIHCVIQLKKGIADILAENDLEN